MLALASQRSSIVHRATSSSHLDFLTKKWSRRKRPRQQQEQPTFQNFTTTPPTLLSSFSQQNPLPTELHTDLKWALEKNGVSSLTEIQARTWKPALEGKDIVGRSQTGSGKTLAYLLPSLQQLQDQKQHGSGGVSFLILAPTRELVQQIHSTVVSLTMLRRREHPTTVQYSPHVAVAQAIYGGIPKRRDVQVWETQGIPTILTATPGRLQHHLRMTDGEPNFREFLQSVEIVVLDEMDRLLDMGFRQAILAILASLPLHRQTLLFSATSPPSVQQLIQQATRSGNRVYIDCRNAQQSDTVETVEQTYAILPVDKLVAGIVRTVLHLMKAPNHKIIVFFPTTSQVAYFADLFNTGLGRRVWELRSPMPQTARSTQADAFRYARTGILFTTDVSARGIDYPNVTAVVQVGAAPNRETYIHRLGRTARAGQSGVGVVLFMEGEASASSPFGDLDIKLDTKIQRLLEAEYGNSMVDEELVALRRSIGQGKAKRLEQHAAAAYVGLFSFYTQHFHVLGLDSSMVVRLVNSFAEQAGLTTLPPVPSHLAKQFRLDGHPRLNVQRVWKDRTFDVGGHRIS